MFIAEVRSKGKKGRRYKSILLRESYRQGARVKSRTLAVLTRLPAWLIEVIRQALAAGPADSVEGLVQGSGGTLALRTGESFGGCWLVAQLTRRLGIDQALGVTRSAELARWQVIARVLRPGTSLLAMVRLANTCAAAAVLRWRRPFTEEDLYANGTWLQERQAIIEKRLWQHAEQERDQLYLYDVTSSYLEGEHNALGDWGYNRDGKKGKQQVVVGLLTDEQGEPCSVQVYAGNTSDPKTFADQVHKLKQRFGCRGVTLVGDRGMIRSRQMAQAQAQGFHFITALTRPQIEKLLRTDTFQLELFEEQVTEVMDGQGRRYVLRRNPVRAEELARSRAAKREALAREVQKANDYLRAHPRAKVPTQQRALMARLQQLRVEGWLRLRVASRQLQLVTDAAALAEAARLDGCYVIHTDLAPSAASAQTVHDRYRDLARVERDFRTLKSGHLEFRPWFVITEANTRAHALTAMLALKVRRHLEQAWSALDLTVEEGLREMERLNVMELVATRDGKVVTRLLPRPSARQEQLLAALDLKLPETVPAAQVQVGTRVKLPARRKSR